MSLVRLDIKKRLELETRVLAAALKMSFQRGDKDGIKLAHQQLSKLVELRQIEEAGGEVTHAHLDPPERATRTAQNLDKSLKESANQVAEAPAVGPRQAPRRSDVTDPRLPISQGGSVPSAQGSSENKAQSQPVPGQIEASKPPIPTSSLVAGQNGVGFANLLAARSSVQPASSEPQSRKPGEQAESKDEKGRLLDLNDKGQPGRASVPPAAAPDRERGDESPGLKTAAVTPSPVPSAHAPSPGPSAQASAPSARGPSAQGASAPAPSGPSAQGAAQGPPAKVPIPAPTSSPGSPPRPSLPAQPTPQGQSKAPAARQEEKHPELEYQALYRLLGVSQMSAYEEIHRNFLRLIRGFIRQIEPARRENRVDLLNSLRKIWIAHDILTDPVTRTDYDFRDLGLRGNAEAIATLPPTPEDKQQAQQTNRTPTRIGELLQCAGLLEPAELQIACDMHKAMPEVLFGTFLVKSGFIGERDLESVLLGQKLLRAGTISVAQFQVSMDLSTSRGCLIRETLIERGYVNAEQIEKVIQASEAPSTVPAIAVPQIINAAVPAPDEEKGLGLGLAAALPKITDLVDFEPMDSTSSSGTNALTELLSPVAPTAKEEPAATLPPKTLNIAQAVPSWLDWDAPPAEETDHEEGKEQKETTTGEAETESASGSKSESVSNSESITRAAAESGSVTASDTTSQLDKSAEAERTKEINLTRALPSWKDQLDWDAPPEEEAQSQSQDTQLEPEEIDSSGSEQSEAGSDEDDKDEEIDYQFEDDWPIESQMETATHLQAIKIHDLQLKPGKGKKNKKKQKNVNRQVSGNEHSTPPKESIDEIIK